MDLVHWCLLIMGLLPIVCAGISKAGARSYDNRNPREWLAAQEGYRKRAVAAQQNSWEAFAFSQRRWSWQPRRKPRLMPSKISRLMWCWRGSPTSSVTSQIGIWPEP